MPRIDTDRVAHVAGLAHIALTPEEIKCVVGGLDVITTFVAKASEAATADIPVASHAIPLTSVIHEDVMSPTLDREEILSQAPTPEEGMFLVPQILEEE